MGNYLLDRRYNFYQLFQGFRILLNPGIMTESGSISIFEIQLGKSRIQIRHLCKARFRIKYKVGSAMQFHSDAKTFFCYCYFLPSPLGFLGYCFFLDLFFIFDI